MRYKSNTATVRGFVSSCKLMDPLVCIEASTSAPVYCVVKATPTRNHCPASKDGTRADTRHKGVCLFLYPSYTTAW